MEMHIGGWAAEGAWSFPFSGSGIEQPGAVKHCNIGESVHPTYAEVDIYIFIFVQMMPEERAIGQSRTPGRDHVCEVEHGTNFDRRKDSS